MRAERDGLAICAQPDRPQTAGEVLLRLAAETAEMTVGDALKAAVADIDAAIARRDALVRYAVARGASYRGIARHLGVAPATVHRWGTGGKPTRSDVDPLALPAPTFEERGDGKR